MGVLHPSMFCIFFNIHQPPIIHNWMQYLSLEYFNLFCANVNIFWIGNKINSWCTCKSIGLMHWSRRPSIKHHHKELVPWSAKCRRFPRACKGYIGAIDVYVSTWCEIIMSSFRQLFQLNFSIGSLPVRRFINIIITANLVLPMRPTSISAAKFVCAKFIPLNR